MVRSSAPLPLTPYRLVRSDEFEQVLERLRINVPTAIRESERLLNERDQFIAEAQAEAQRIVKEARQQAAHLVSERALVAQAQQTADRIERQARAAARRRSDEADTYAVDVLERLAQHLRDTLEQVENGILVMQSEDETPEGAHIAHESVAPNRPAIAYESAPEGVDGASVEEEDASASDADTADVDDEAIRSRRT